MINHRRLGYFLAAFGAMTVAGACGHSPDQAVTVQKAGAGKGGATDEAQKVKTQCGRNLLAGKTIRIDEQEKVTAIPGIAVCSADAYDAKAAKFPYHVQPGYRHFALSRSSRTPAKRSSYTLSLRAQVFSDTDDHASEVQNLLTTNCLPAMQDAWLTNASIRLNLSIESKATIGKLIPDQALEIKSVEAKNDDRFYVTAWPEAAGLLLQDSKSCVEQCSSSPEGTGARTICQQRCSQASVEAFCPVLNKVVAHWVGIKDYSNEACYPVTTPESKVARPSNHVMTAKKISDMHLVKADLEAIRTCDDATSKVDTTASTASVDPASDPSAPQPRRPRAGSAALDEAPEDSIGTGSDNPAGDAAGGKGTDSAADKGA